MNLLDAHVVSREGESYYKYDAWWVPVQYVCEGRPSLGSVMCKTKEEADAVDTGYVYQV